MIPTMQGLVEFDMYVYQDVIITPGGVYKKGGGYVTVAWYKLAVGRTRESSIHL